MPLELNRPVLDWRLSELDFDTMRKSVIELGMRLAEQGIARIRVRDWLLADVPEVPGTAEEEVGGWHHMCTTRMSDDPRQGVVDYHCRVHGISNLFVGGSSSFATAGHANPTYTIVQLALRLGDHLVERLKA
jgi:choline dehydrogenase-like flavoprotein